jgi:hypothetical protein
MRERDWRILHVAEPMTMHDLALKSWRQYWRRAVRTGHAFAQVSSLFARTSDPLWKRESRLNVVRGLFWTGMPSFSLTLSLWYRSPLPLLFAILLTLFLTLRSAWKSRFKTTDARTLLLYGVHSHLQQIPIFLGQLSFWMGRVSNKQPTLIEYKEMA